ncbi:MAG: sugar porter family MFS transporter [Verrucomicrobia bacterium]|nr:sugar porter family MFS transporter [Verrucomicrobiota bacterium]
MKNETLKSSSPGNSGHGSMGYLTFVCVVAALGGLLFGFDTVVIGGTVPAVKAQFALDQWLEGLFVASALIGCMFGSGFAGVLSDAFGRKKVLILSSVLFLATGLGCSMAWDHWSLLAFRFIGGAGIGVASMVCPLYISEISPASVRGRMVTLFQFAITIGIVVCLFSNAAIEHLSRQGTPGAPGGLYQWMFVDQVWRAMFLMATLPAVFFAALTLFIPESPRWLAKAGLTDRARDILARVGGMEAAERSLAEIKDAIAEETGRFSDLFRGGARKALFIALFLSLVSELSGVTVVLYYGPDILKNAGVQLSDALGGFVIIGLCNMAFTVIALWLMDRAGRRQLLFWGTLGCAAVLATIGGLFASNQTGGGALVALICLFFAFFAFSIGPIKWVMMSEIFPTKIRGRAIAIATVAVWLGDTVTNYFFPWAREHWGPAVCFFVFAAVLVPQLIFVLTVMPETKGQTLEEIEESFARD